MSEKVGGVGTVAGQADVLTHVTTHHQSFWCTVRSIALLSPDGGHLQSREGRLFLRLDALWNVHSTTASWSKLHQKVLTARSPVPPFCFRWGGEELIFY